MGTEDEAAVGQLGTERQVGPVLRCLSEINQLIESREGLISIEDLEVKTAQAGFERQKTTDEFDDSGLKLLRVEAEEPVFSNKGAPAGLGFLWIEVTETAKNLITEAPRNDLIPKGLLVRLDELDQRVRFPVAAQWDGMCGVSDE